MFEQIFKGKDKNENREKLILLLADTKASALTIRYPFPTIGMEQTYSVLEEVLQPAGIFESTEIDNILDG